MATEESKFQRFKKWVNRNITFIYFTIALVFILFPNSTFSLFTEKWNKVIEKIGFIALTSGVFAGVLKSIQFTGLFKDELQKVISGSDFLNNRKDLPDLWKKVSKILYSEKFPEISDLLEDRILATYFPTNRNHYNEDLIITIIIHEITDDFTIHYTQTMEYNAILDSNIKQTYINFTSSITDNDSVDEINNLISFKVDNEEMKDKVNPEERTENNEKIKSYTHQLKGKKKFFIHNKTERKYSLKGENFKMIRFNTFIKNLDVTVSYPNDIEVSFFGIGVVNDFVSTHDNIENVICRRHREDLILPRQGFGLSFNKK
ncbi:hypothetical protein [Chryseobacterium sp.]|uniref:hypothetical protein n=1 Tax=Chryseobacterium sp. TaxID=1871047 RepID=UPI00321B0FD6